MFSHAKSVVKQFDEVEEKMLNINQKEKIRIGSTITVGECILSDLINIFTKKEPNIEVYSYMNNTQIIESKLLNSEIDIGIVEGEIKSPDLICVPEVKDYLVLICSTSHPLPKEKPLNWKSLLMKALP